MIKNIVFDMGGVLIDFDPIRSVKNHFASEDRNAVLANIFRSRNGRQWIRVIFRLRKR